MWLFGLLYGWAMSVSVIDEKLQYACRAGLYRYKGSKSDVIIPYSESKALRSYVGPGSKNTCQLLFFALVRMWMT
jgi:hypothetical protein